MKSCLQPLYQVHLLWKAIRPPWELDAPLSNFHFAFSEPWPLLYQLLEALMSLKVTAQSDRQSPGAVARRQ